MFSEIAKAMIAKKQRGSLLPQLKTREVTENDQNKADKLCKHISQNPEAQLKRMIMDETNKCFKSLDNSGDGMISSVDITAAFATFDMQVENRESESILEVFDITRNRAIEFDDFYHTMYETFANGITEEQIQLVFDSMDGNRDGYIEVDDVIKVFKRFGLSGDEKDAREAIDRIIEDEGGGRIDFFQFKRFCRNLDDKNFRIEKCCRGACEECMVLDRPCCANIERLPKE